MTTALIISAIRVIIAVITKLPGIDTTDLEPAREFLTQAEAVQARKV